MADPGTYQRVTNLSTSEAFEQKDGAVMRTTTADAPCSYQGDLAASTELPWSLSIRCTLNENDVSPQELQGADGVLSITLEVQAHTDGADVQDFSNSYVLQAQGTFPEESFVASDNTLVDSVQFIYVLDRVEEPSESALIPQTSKKNRMTVSKRSLIGSSRCSRTRSRFSSPKHMRAPHWLLLLS